MTISHRLLDQNDADASIRLGQEAFGFPSDPAPATVAPAKPFPPAGAHAHGIFDGDELAARLFAREYLSHFAGEQVPTCGIAGVTVKAEYRGRGLLTDLFAAVHDAAKDRGEVISTLFPTAPGIYRRFGYELVGDYSTVEIPSAALASIRRPAGIEVRRAGVDDAEAIQRVYHQWASSQHGPLTRTGPSFSGGAAEFLDSFNGVTVAVDSAQQVVGFASWDRGPSTGRGSAFEVSDLIGSTAAATAALWSVVASFASVTGKVKVDTSGDDLARFALPSVDWSVVSPRPYMLAVLDVAGAFTARSVTAAIAAELEFAIAGHPIGAQNGGYRLNVGAGQVDCRHASDSGGVRTYSPQGIAVAYAGTQSSANLRTVGMLSGGDPGDDSVWDALFGGHQFHIRDYF
ncbi:GNAT family N-acetyltransferase [Nakamurella lactea]|uniref:GNAT family N-acetyltransferase n=1 Tax=Nakamurella lactea TaxID=459515 RepID=UPI0004237076|nr:GNAT family N-acetyltransferase [Nakamurella lactea]